MIGGHNRLNGFMKFPSLKHLFLLVFALLVFIFGTSLFVLADNEEQYHVPRIRPQEYYEKTLKSHAKTFIFSERTVKYGDPVMSGSTSWNSMLTDSLLLAGGIYSSYGVNESLSEFGVGSSGLTALMAIDALLMLGTMADSYLSDKMTEEQQTKKFRSLIEVICWDAHLLDAQLLLHAERELISDLHLLEEHRKNLYLQFPVDEVVIFQVRIHNQDTANIQLQPFTWHLFLEDFQGNRNKMLKYDPQLDGAIRPGQYVEGFVYFSRKDLNTGRFIVPSGSKVKLILEEFSGKHSVMEFK